ncbi:MAG: cupin-like domain-containing protein [Pseudomonadota bacterium]
MSHPLPHIHDTPPAAPELFAGRIERLRLARDGISSLRRAIDECRPVVIEDLAADWPATTRWSPQRLRERYGDKTVRVYDASFGTPGAGYMGSVDAIPFAQFLDAVLEGGRDLRMFLYNISRQIPELLDDVRFPKVGLRFSRRFVFTFFGCQGSTTPLHYDIDMGHVLHTVIRGRRRVRLFAPDQSEALYKHPFTVRSYVDLDALDTAQFPALARARGLEVVLEAGQTLFMPAGYWHEFHYLSAGIGLSMRAPSPRVADRVAGLANLLILSPIDRAANKVAPNRWYQWKQRRAAHRGQQSLLSDLSR